MLVGLTKQCKLSRTLRAGIIPYTCINGNYFFCLGRDTASGELTDFGGGVRKNETIFEGANREFHEETRNVFAFDINDRKIASQSIVVQTDYMTIFFVNVSDRYISLSKQLFHTSKSIDAEINDIFWINEVDFVNLVKYGVTKTHRMWGKVSRFFLKSCAGF